MFDTREYEFADITVIAGGIDVEGLRGIKVTQKQEKEVVYGKGNKPRSVQKKNKSYEIELTATQSSIETLAASSVSGSLLDIQIDVVVSFGNPSKGDALMTKFVKGVQFTEEPVEFKQGDAFAEITIPGIALDVKTERL
jgi:hypothetical protein